MQLASFLLSTVSVKSFSYRTLWSLASYTIARNVICSEIICFQILLHNPSHFCFLPCALRFSFTLCLSLHTSFHVWVCFISFQENSDSKGWHCKCPNSLLLNSYHLFCLIAESLLHFILISKLSHAIQSYWLGHSFSEAEFAYPDLSWCLICFSNLRPCRTPNERNIDFLTLRCSHFILG